MIKLKLFYFNAGSSKQEENTMKNFSMQEEKKIKNSKQKWRTKKGEK